jgi:hypothetical protein
MQCAAGATCTIRDCPGGNCSIGCQQGATCSIERCGAQPDAPCNAHAAYTSPGAQP